MTNRTKKGNVTAESRKKYGNARGAFPVFDAKSASSAIKLRGHANSSAERAQVISKAAKYLPDAAAKARAADKKGGKKKQ